MTFLNAILLLGGAAFMVPLIIHLLNRRRVNHVQWAAMHLLREAMKQKKQKLEVEQLLLLAVRIAIPLVLALCLARPVMTFFRSLPGLGKSSLVMLLDDSFSMRAPAQGGSAAERARQDASVIFKDMPAGSEVQVVLAGGNARRLMDQPTTALELMPKQLSELPSMAGPVQANDLFQTGAATLGKMSNTARELVVVSDFQQRDWQAVADGGSLPALEALNKQEIPPQITFYRIASDLTENLSIASADVSAQAVAADQPIGLRVLIQNHGKRAWQDVVVYLEADGARLRTSRVSLPAEGQAVISFTHSFGELGDHSLAVRVEGDSFPDDNAFFTVVQVRDQLNTLLVDGHPGNEPLTGATDFLELALAPGQALKATTLRDLIHTTKIDARRFREEDLRGKECVILADVDKLQGNRLNDLQRFVKNGGGLLIFAGPHLDFNWYNKDFFNKGEGLLPLAIKGFQRIDNDSQPARLLQQRFTHPALIYFNEGRGGRLQDAEFRHWLQFDPTSASAKAPVQTILQLDRNLPLLLEKAYGEGRVLAAATGADAEWSNLPLQTFFVPMMQRLVTYLSTQKSRSAWQTVGDSLKLPVTKEQSSTEWTLRDPSGQIQKLEIRQENEQTFVVSPAIAQPGIYQLTGAGQTRLLAFNLDASESDLTPLAESQVAEIASRYGATFVDSIDAWHKVDRTRRHGSELWQPLLLALLALLFFEVLLSQRIAKA